MKNKLKTEVKSIRLTPEIAEALNGIENVSEFVRQAILEKIRRDIISDGNVEELTNKVADFFENHHIIIQYILNPNGATRIDDLKPADRKLAATIAKIILDGGE